jgi:hypothetical protein
MFTRLKELLSESEWSGAVTKRKPGTFARKGTHTGSAEQIYSEYKRKGVSPHGLGSAIQMLQFFINRAGKNLHNGPALRKAIRMLQLDLEKEHAKEDKKNGISDK